MVENNRAALIIGLLLIFTGAFTKLTSLISNDQFCDGIISQCNVSMKEDENVVVWNAISIQFNASIIESPVCKYPYQDTILKGWFISYCYYKPSMECPYSSCETIFPNRPADGLSGMSILFLIFGFIGILISLCITPDIKINITLKSPIIKLMKQRAKNKKELTKLPLKGQT